MSLSATDRAYGWLRSAILAGDLPSGEFVEEASVCDAAAVSRTPVREAFHRLAGERLIELVPRRGARVRDLSVRDVVDAFNSRWIIESAAIDELLRDGNRHWEPVIDQMRLDAEAMENTDGSSANGMLDYVALDKSFHRGPVAALGNAVLLDFYDTLWPLHEWSVLRARMNSALFFEKINAEHREIFRSVRERDAVAARAALFQHLKPFNS